MSDSIDRVRAEGAMLTGFWYPAMLSKKLRRLQLKGTTLLGKPLVIGRDQSGRAFALLDSCPHRGIPLRFGRVEGSTVECCYHGWRFDTATGQCREIPSLIDADTLKLDRIRAGWFKSEDRDGYIWVFIEDRDSPQREAPPVPELPVFSSRYQLTHLTAELPCNIDHAIIGLMDPAHGPFVHRAWWWRNQKSIHAKQKIFEPIPDGFRICAHAPSSNSAPYKLLRVYGEPITSTIEFTLPSTRVEMVRCGRYWFTSRAIVTPIASDRSRLDFCAAWNIFGTSLVVPLFRFFARKFIRQDQRTMEKQALGLAHHPAMMLIDDADRPARWYFQLKSRYLESRKTGISAVHPISGPVTLRWRS